jgi:archaellum biogenesis protein FlaJ (TadC family)
VKSKKKVVKKEKEKKKSTKILRRYMDVAGVKSETSRIAKIIFNVCIFLNLVFSGYLIWFFIQHKGYPILYIIGLTLMIWTLAFLALVFFVWLFFFVFMDFKIFHRRKSIEEALPDFLHFTATNIRAGMTVEKAMWFAVRPRFGVLAKEIETVAKEVMSGSDLGVSLERFATKYNSNVLKRSVNLIVEGMDAGGEIGNLLTKIATHIEEVRLMKKEMAANVTTYVIFITFAAIIATPALLALSSQLLGVIGEIFSSIDIPSGTQMMFSIKESAVTPENFRTFSVLVLFITSLFSAMIISVIKKGNVVEGIKYIPTYIIVSLLIYFAASSLLGSMMSGIF